jgi:predicted secreted protein
MASDGVSGTGALLTRNNYPVLQITEVTGPKNTAVMHEISNWDSILGWKEWVAGMKEGGSFVANGIYLRTDTNGQIGSIADFNAGTSRTWRICIPNGGLSMAFTAIVEGWDILARVSDTVKLAIGLKEIGAITIYETASAGITTPFLTMEDNSGNLHTLTPTVSNSVYGYLGAIHYVDTGAKVAPTAAAGTIYVNGAVVTSGSYCTLVPIAAGKSGLFVIEVRETNKASKVYRVRVDRPSS